MDANKLAFPLSQHVTPALTLQLAGCNGARHSRVAMCVRLPVS